MAGAATVTAPAWAPYTGGDIDVPGAATTQLTAPPSPPAQAWGGVTGQPGQPTGQAAKNRTPAIAIGLVLLLAIGGLLWILLHQSGAQPLSDPGSSASPGSSDSENPSGVAPDPGTSEPATSSAAPVPATDATVQLDPSVTAPESTAVVSLLQRHFDAINATDYPSYASTLAHPATQADFASGYSTTHDTNMRITSIESTGPSSAVVGLSFTSTQDPSQAPPSLQVGRICWQVRWQLVGLSNGGQINGSQKGTTSMQAC